MSSSEDASSFAIPQRPRKPSSTSSSSTPTPTAILSAAPTPAPSRNPSLFPGSDASPSNANDDNDRAPRGAPAFNPFASAEYMSALAAAAQASLNSAPTTPGGDLPIARSSNNGSGSGSGGDPHQQPSSYFQPPPQQSDDDGHSDEEPRFTTTSFLDVEPGEGAASSPSSTAAGRHDDEDVGPDELVGGPVGEDEEGGDDGPGHGRGYVNPVARARAGVSVAKGEGLVEQARPMLGGAGQEGASGGGARARQQSWSEQDMRHDMTARFWNGGGPVQGYDSTSNGV